MTGSSDILRSISTHWGWVGADPIAFVGKNAFGNVIFKQQDHSYWRLIPEECECSQIAADDQAYERLVADAEFNIDWGMLRLVQLAREGLGPLESHYCYYLMVPAVLGGRYETENIRSAPLLEIIEYSGELAKQIKDLPDGAEIELKVME